MSKRPHNSQKSNPAFEDLIGHLKAAGNDVARLREIVESNDAGSIAAAFAAMLTSATLGAVNHAKRQKKDSEVGLILIVSEHLSSAPFLRGCITLYS